MKPLNLDNSPCTPTSSNCVIWQGPSIPCIKLCTGDTVSDVVFKLGTELCEILDALNVSNYDLACLNLAGCDPKDFQALIQILIDKICELENIPGPTPSPDKGTCPTECVVTVAACLGGGTDFLLNYVQTIANKVCDLAGDILALQNDIDTINITLLDLQDQINDIVSNPYTLPDISHSCQIGAFGPGTSQKLDLLFQAFINDWCTFLGLTGTNTEIAAAVSSQCIVGTDVALQYQYTTAAIISVAYPTFDTTPVSIANAINNLWITVCDVRNAGKELAAVVAGTNTTVTSATSVVGNNLVTTYTVNADGIDIKNEGITLTTSASSIDFVGDMVNATVIGNDVTVTVNQLGGMLAQQTPTNLSSTAFGLVNTLCFQPVQIITQVYDDDAAYDPVTGIWTCPATGRYNLSCYAHYTRETGTGWYDAVNPGGMFGISINSSTGCNYYCANWMTIMNIQTHIDITAQAMGMELTAGLQLSVKVLNQTGYNYTSTLGDVIRLSIQRIK